MLDAVVTSTKDARATAVIAAHDGTSRVLRARPAGALRLLFPRGAGHAAWIVTSNFGGGLVDGDRLALDLDVETGATCVLTSQASNKVYRGKSEQSLTLTIGEGASALVIPDPTVPFRGASFTQRTRIALAKNASVAYLDTVTAGRIAHGERWDATSLDIALDLESEGVLRVRDRMRLDASDGDISARLRGYEALATIAIVGPRFTKCLEFVLDRARDERADARAEAVIAASEIDGGAMIRIAARTVALAIERARELLAPACEAIGEAPWSRKW